MLPEKVDRPTDVLLEGEKMMSNLNLVPLHLKIYIQNGGTVGRGCVSSI